MKQIIAGMIIPLFLIILQNCSSTKMDNHLENHHITESLSICARKKGNSRVDCFERLHRKYYNLYEEESKKVNTYRKTLSNMEEEIYNAKESEIKDIQKRVETYKELLKVHSRHLNDLQYAMDRCQEAL